jgi:hypothetical protein
MTKPEWISAGSRPLDSAFRFRASGFFRHSCFVLRHSQFFASAAKKTRRMGRIFLTGLFSSFNLIDGPFAECGISVPRRAGADFAGFFAKKQKKHWKCRRLSRILNVL